MSFVHFRRKRRSTAGPADDIEIELPSTPSTPQGGGTPTGAAPQLSRSTTVRLSASGHVRSPFAPKQTFFRQPSVTQRDDDEGSDLPEDATDVGIHEDGATEYGVSYGSSAAARAPRSAFIERLWSMQWSGRGKQVDAAEDVLANYHDSVLYAPVTFSTKTRALMRGGWFNFQRNLVEFVISVLALILYIRWTYSQHLDPWYIALNAVVSFYFVVHYAMEFYSAPVRSFYVLSPTGIVDILSILPIFWVFSHSSANGLQILRFTRILRIQKVLKRLGILGTSVVHAIFILFINVFGIIFIFAALFQYIETRWPPEGSDCPEHGCLTFFDAFYYIIVTISTVGYGDITADTSWGRVITIICIFTALIVIPAQLSGIIGLYTSRPYGGSFSVAKVVGSRYIIIAGNLTYSTIQAFLAYLFHPGSTRDLAAFPLRVVLMAPYKPSFELKGLISMYAGFVEFIQGTPFLKDDLERVGANAASTIFLLPDKSVENQAHDDSQSFVRALRVSRTVGKRTRVIAQVAEPESVFSPIWDGTHVEVLCPQELRMRLLARSCFVRGMSTFLTNLFTRPVHFRNPQKDWLAEYYHGALQQVFPVLLPRAVQGLPFEQAAELFYLQYGVTLFALDVLDGVDGERHVYLFPHRHVITATDVGLTIAATIQSAEQISKFGQKDLAEQRRKLEKENSLLCNCACCIRVTKSRFKKEEDALEALQASWAEEGLGPGQGELTVGHVHGASVKRLGSASEGRIKQVEQMRTMIDAKKDPNGVMWEREDGPEGEAKCKQVAGLEEAVERLLAWPPASNFGKPSDAVIEKQEAAILANLKERTLTAVTPDKGPLIVVCISNAPPSDLYHLLAELREGRVPFRNVVILNPVEPPATVWGHAGLFEGVYFVKGSPMYELDLLRAGVLQAEKVIVLSEDGAVRTGQDTAREDGPLAVSADRFVNDVNNLITVSAVERLPRVSRHGLPAADADPAEEPEWSGIVLAEMQREFAFLFMRPHSYLHPRKFDYMERKRNESTSTHYALSYADGKAWSPGMLDCLVYATFSNKQTMSIMRQLVAGGDVDSTEDDTSTEEDLPPEQRLFETVPVPEEYAGHSYRSVFVSLLHNQGYLALGLYRAWGTKKAPIAYVFTNPPGDTLVQKNDLVYVLR